MKKVIHIGLVAGAVAILITGATELAFANSRNDLFEFCTTKAYGWPTPWKIDYCECEGAKTIYPNSSKIINLAAVGGSGLFTSLFFGGIAYLRRRG